MTSLALAPNPSKRDLRKAILARWSRLETERSPWLGFWSELGRFILPKSARMTTTDRNRTSRSDWGNILDNRATMSVRVLSAGLMAGMTSPARPWFRLTTQDPELRQDQDVREWLDEVVTRMQRVFARSNIYRCLQMLYEDLAIYGVGSLLVLPDPDRVVHCYPMAIGEFALQQDFQGKVTACYRRFERTVGEVVREFGLENVSRRVRDAWNNRQFESAVQILHAIEPRDMEQRNIRSPLARDMPWRSVWLEWGDVEDDKILRESGYRRMRVLAPRWSVRGNDVYGISPAMDAFGDVRQLQHEQLRKGQVIDYRTKPPLQVPTTLKDREFAGLPGGIQYYEPAEVIPFDQVGPQGGIRPAFEVDLDLNALLVDVQDIRARISRAFHEDLFLMLASRPPDGRMTATEVLERHEEKLIMLGPTLERLQNELLDPLIDVTFFDMLEAGLLPPPPEVLMGQELAVEFVSFLAQAQKAVGISAVQQFIGDVLAVAPVRPDVLDKVNFDAWVARTADMRGIDASLLVDDEEVRQLREARARAEAMREQLQVASEASAAAKNLSAAEQGGQASIADVMQGLTGGVVPQQGVVP